jgi:secreted PhoX family phosphatase
MKQKLFRFKNLSTRSNSYMSHSFDPIDNTSNNEHFQEVLDKALTSPSRRNILRGGLGLASMFALPMLPGCGGTSTASNAAVGAITELKFTTVAKSIADQVWVPAGYTVKVLHATGDTMKTGVTAYSNAGTDDAESWANRVGDQHDGTEIFYIGANGKSKGSYSYAAGDKAVLAVNNESSAEAHFLHPTGQTSGVAVGKKFDQFNTTGAAWTLGVRPASEAIKEILMHGVTLVEVKLDASGKPTGYDATSSLNRRITPETVMTVTGPAAELANLKAMMVTKFDPTGATTRGTLNNCGTGITPWGTLITCEENWATYFTMPAGATVPTDAKLIASRKRYSVQDTATSATATTSRTQGWHTVTDADPTSRFARWDVSASGATAAADFRNEPQTFGYNVEIDPANPSAAPAKRMAMGRFAHEAAVCGIPVVGKPLAFYMGCDSRNEYIYKFVSAKNWDAADIGGGIAAGDKYLNEGKLYAAKFNATGQGEWLELSINNPLITAAAFGFTNQAEVLVHTRVAADAAGATKMDRPEWGAVNHANGEIYFALTNNTAANRLPGKTDAANPRAYKDNDGIGRDGNPNGHIIRFKETNSMAEATTFAWDIFLFGAEEDAPKSNVNISGLTAVNSFSSPDGLWFSKSTGICWIQTDDGAFTDETNCMLVAAVPGKVGDGGAFTVSNTMTVAGAAQTVTQNTFVGQVLGESRLRRFLVGPVGAEVTGITETPDGKAIFVGIQHPGELATAYNDTTKGVWPTNAANGAGGAYGAGSRPRSATIVITKDDGGRIGL